MPTAAIMMKTAMTAIKMYIILFISSRLSPVIKPEIVCARIQQGKTNDMARIKKLGMGFVQYLIFDNFLCGCTIIKGYLVRYQVFQPYD